LTYAGSPVEAWYEAAPADIEGMRSLLGAEVEFSVCAGWPNGGVFRGRESVLRDFFPRAAEAWEWMKPRVDGVIEAGDTYVVNGRYTGVASGSQVSFSLEFVHIWRVEDGALVFLRQVADTAILDRASPMSTP
jgi:ketosteroid isomerase-like protein